jgi:hypothetical protein
MKHLVVRLKAKVQKLKEWMNKWNRDDDYFDHPFAIL